MPAPALTVFGPFYRQESPTQTGETVRKVLRSGELWGHAPRGSDRPAVQAFRKPDPGKPGMAFYTAVAPHSPYGPVLYWYGGDEGVRLEGDVAKLEVLVSRVDQDF